MSAESAVLVRSFRVGKWTCTITVPRLEHGVVSCIAVEWSPGVPRRLSARHFRQYQAGRNRVIAELVTTMGAGPALIVEQAAH